MKRFIAFFLSFQLIFCMTFCIKPFNSSASEFTITDVTNYKLSDYKLFFIYAEYSDSSLSKYVLVCIKNNSNYTMNDIRFFNTSDINTSKFDIMSNTTRSYGFDYDGMYYYFNTDGSYNTYVTFSDNSSSCLYKFDFYDMHPSTGIYRKIIASNADIIDVDGTLLMYGDYNNFKSYFDRPDYIERTVNDYSSEQPTTQPTTEPTSNGGDDNEGDTDYSGLLGGIKGIIDALLKPISEIIETINNLEDNFTSRFHDVTTVLNTLFSKAEVIDNSITNFNTSFTTYSETINTAINTVNTKITELNTTIDTKITELTTEIDTKITQLNTTFDTKLTFMSTLFDFDVENSFAFKLGKLFEDLNIDIKGTIESAELNIKLKIDSLIDRIDVNFGDLKLQVENSSDDVVRAVNTMSASLGGKLDNIYDVAVDISGRVNDVQVAVYDIGRNIVSSVDSLKSALLSGLQSINNSVNSIPSSMREILIDLFVPTENNNWHEVVELINNKFGFVNQILDIGDFILGVNFSSSPPENKIVVDSDTYGHFEADIVDWSVVAPYLPVIKNITSGITLYFFIRRTRKRLPAIISGIGVD